MLSAVIPSELSYPAMPLARQLEHHRFVHPGPLVLGTAPLKYPAPTTDRDRTVSRRSEPSSRTALIGEQPNPWDLIQPQDAMSRHRGAKPPRRCELLGGISLLSPAYLLSVERLVSLAVKLPYAFTLYDWFPISLREPSRASVTLLEATAPVKLPTRQCP
jgi:hypothetical protein